MRRYNIKEFIGKRFGKLVIINTSKIRDLRNQKMVKVKCDCGNESLVVFYYLIKRNWPKNSCGCERIKHNNLINHLPIKEKKCGKCQIIKNISEFWKSKNEPDGYQHACKNCRKIIAKKYNNKPETKIKIRECSKRLYYKNKNSPEHIERRRISNSKYNKWRTKHNKKYRLKKLLQRRMLLVLRGKQKSAPTMKLLGCTIDELKSHLQKTAIENGYKDFDINNYSGKDYHIDHIKPCASFDLKESNQQKECFNWKNLQILDAFTNISLSDKRKC